MGLCVYACSWQKKKKERKIKETQGKTVKSDHRTVGVPIPPGAEQAWQEVGAASHSQQHPQPQSMLGILWEACVANSRFQDEEPEGRGKLCFNDV